jgi:hypothetical protein
MDNNLRNYPRIPIAGLLVRILLLLAFTPAAAFAQTAPDTARHIDFTKVLTGFDGKLIVTSDKNSEKLTLGAVCVNALEISLDEDRGASGQQKFEADQLARKIWGKNDAVLKAEEIALLKTRIGKTYGPLVVGAAWRLLDPAESK